MFLELVAKNKRFMSLNNNIKWIIPCYNGDQSMARRAAREPFGRQSLGYLCTYKLMKIQIMV